MMTRVLFLLFASFSCMAQPPAGRWDGVVTYGDLKIPFTLNLSPSADGIGAVLVNGDVEVPATGPGKFDGKRLTLQFSERLDATLVEGALKGTYGGKTVNAAPYCTCSFEGSAGPAVMGRWRIAELEWTLDITRKGEDTLVIITRPDNKIGPLQGRHDGLAFQLHYFDGERAALLELEERKDGGLDVVWMEPGKPPLRTRAVPAAAKASP